MQQAETRYKQFEELIEYCDEVNSQLPEELQIKGQTNLLVNYKELQELNQQAQEQRDKIEALQIQFEVI